jgi:hypothetical protein
MIVTLNMQLYVSFQVPRVNTIFSVSDKKCILFNSVTDN